MGNYQKNTGGERMVKTAIIVNRVATAIKEMKNANDFKVILGYVNDIKPVPVTKPIVAVSLKECDIGKRKIVINDLGEEQETLQRDVSTNVSVDIYLPYAYKQSLGIQIFDEITHCLFNHELLNISEASCEEAHYDVASQTILIRSSFNIVQTELP